MIVQLVPKFLIFLLYLWPSDCSYEKFDAGKMDFYQSVIASCFGPMFLRGDINILSVGEINYYVFGDPIGPAASLLQISKLILIRD